MIITFTLQSITDGALMTGKAGNTTVYLSKDFGTYTQATNYVVEVGRGEYKLTLTASESNYTTELHYQPVCSGAITNTYAVGKDTVIPSDYAKSTEITALQNHGDSTWNTATGFATPSDIPTVVQIQSGLATSAALATVDTVVDAIKAKTDTLVNTDLTGIATTQNVTAAVTSIETFGNTNWKTAIIPNDYAKANDLATVDTVVDAIKTKVDTLNNTDISTLAKSTEITALQTHGDSYWLTATGFAVPGSQMTLTSAYNAAKTASQLTAADIPTVAQIQAGLSTFNANTDTVTINAQQAATMITATGFSTPANITTAQNAIITHGDSHWTGGGSGGLTAQQVWEYNGGRTITNNIPTVEAIQSGLATTANITSLQTHGDSTWSTATGFAVAGDAMTLTAAYNAAKTASQLTTSDIPTVAAIQAGLAKSSELTGLSTFNAATDVVTLNSAQAATMITATGFATPTNITTAQQAIIAEGTANWKTATIPSDYAKATNLAAVDTIVNNIKTKVDTLHNTDISTLATAVQANNITAAIAVLNSGMLNWGVTDNTLTIYNTQGTATATYSLTRDTDGNITRIEPNAI